VVLMSVTRILARIALLPLLPGNAVILGARRIQLARIALLPGNAAMLMSVTPVLARIALTGNAVMLKFVKEMIVQQSLRLAVMPAPLGSTTMLGFVL